MYVEKRRFWTIGEKKRLTARRVAELKMNCPQSKFVAGNCHHVSVCPVGHRCSMSPGHLGLHTCVCKEQW